MVDENRISSVDSVRKINFYQVGPLMTRKLGIINLVTFANFNDFPVINQFEG